MRKKFVYIGLLIFIIAAVVFFTLSTTTIFGNAFSKGVVVVNTTAESGGFSYAPVATGGNAILITVYTVLSGRANVYLFNSSAFNSWSGYMHSNSPGSGLAYARRLGTAGSSVVENDVSSSELLLTENLSSTGQNGSVVALGGFNGTAYLVIDNTKGSNSSNESVIGVVSYLRVTPSNLSLYRSISMEAGVISLSDLALGIAGIALIVYGIFKREPGIEAAMHGKGAEKEQISKEYIDTLYKDVDKKGKK
jgi:hypothetical protein